MYLILTITKELNMSDWEKVVEKKALSTKYFISVSNMPGWREEYDKKMGVTEIGKDLQYDLEGVGCEGLSFGGMGHCTFSLTPRDDNPITWHNIKKAFNKYITCVDLCS